MSTTTRTLASAFSAKANDSSLVAAATDSAFTADASAYPTASGMFDAFSRRIILGLFETFSRGTLSVVLPDGAMRVFGAGGARSERITDGESAAGGPTNTADGPNARIAGPNARIAGPNARIAGPKARIEIRNPRFFRRCLLAGDIGFGEAYVDGDWTTPDLPAVISWFIANAEACPDVTSDSDRRRTRWTNVLGAFNRIGHLLRANTRSGSRRNIGAHYDLSNDFFRLWLDPGMTYSSALFTSPDESLEDAQERKYDRLCRLLRLAPGLRVLEIGCGWGGFCSHAARHYGVTVDAITISREQYDWTTERMRREGLSDRVRVHFRDYRDLEGTWDRVASIEMLEAVGDAHLEPYFRTIERVLAPEGLAAFQYITFPDSRYPALKRNVDWIQKHIFPGSLLLSIGRIEEVLRGTGTLQLHDLRDFGASYARTLAEWRTRFRGEEPAVRALGFDKAFLRKWDYYLGYCEAAFRTRNISVVQALYTRPNNPALDGVARPVVPVRVPGIVL